MQGCWYGPKYTLPPPHNTIAATACFFLQTRFHFTHDPRTHRNQKQTTVLRATPKTRRNFTDNLTGQVSHNFWATKNDERLSQRHRETFSSSSSFGNDKTSNKIQTQQRKVEDNLKNQHPHPVHQKRKSPPTTNLSNTIFSGSPPLDYPPLRAPSSKSTLPTVPL